jgi:transaldolase
VLGDRSVKIFADGADLDGILALGNDPRISGFTTNLTLMWKAGLSDYPGLRRAAPRADQETPISFDVSADDADEMRQQAQMIAAWAENVYVKIPVTWTSRSRWRHSCATSRTAA